MSQSPQRAQRASVTTHASPALDLKRRRFLLALGAGGAGTAAVAAQPLAAPFAAAAEPPAAEPTQGYRETDHVRDYYASTRI